MFEPGPLERSWRERLLCRVRGYWSDRVVAERLAMADAHAAEGRALADRAAATGDWEPVLAWMRAASERVRT
jgi:hypothetical protein